MVLVYPMKMSVFHGSQMHFVRQHWNLKAGEAYLVDNYRWLHARTDFEDDPTAPRLFFRLWLQVENFEADR